MNGGLGTEPVSTGIPVDISQNIARLRDMINEGIAKARALGISGWENLGRDYLSTLNTIYFLEAKNGLYDSARERIAKLFNQVVPWLKSINLRATPGKKEQQRTQAGGSITNQILRSLGILSEEQVYTPDIPGLPGPLDLEIAGTKIPSWILLAGAGLALVLLLKR